MPLIRPLNASPRKMNGKSSLSKSAKDIVANQKCITDAGPSEFLYLFQNAEFIVTNSFHGTAFAINFGRQFLTIVPSRKSNNSRQKDLLTLMNLTDRMLSDSDPMPDKIQPINYQSIHPLLEIQRNKSITFLKMQSENKTAIRRAPKLCDSATCTGCAACMNICPTGAISMQPDSEGFTARQ